MSTARQIEKAQGGLPPGVSPSEREMDGYLYSSPARNSRRIQGSIVSDTHSELPPNSINSSRSKSTDTLGGRRGTLGDNSLEALRAKIERDRATYPPQQYSPEQAREFAKIQAVEGAVGKALENPESVLFHLVGVQEEDRERLKQLIADFILGKTEVIAIIGPTGSGKSTVLDAVARVAYDVSEKIFPQFGEKSLFISPVYYDREKRVVADDVQKPTTEFGKPESDLINRRFISRVTGVILEDPYVYDSRKMSYRVLMEAPAYPDLKRNVDRGLGAIPELIERYGDRFAVVSLGQHPDIPRIAEETRLVALQTDPATFARKLTELGFIPPEQRQDISRLQENMQISGKPDTIGTILGSLFTELKSELKGKWNEVRSIKLPKELKGLPAKTMNDLKRLIYYMKNVLTQKLDGAADILSLINVPAGQAIRRNA